MCRSLSLPALAVVLLALLAGCSTSGDKRNDACIPHKGMRAETLVQCGCFPAHSGGGSVIIQGRGSGISDSITMVHYICVRGDGWMERVVVVNGVVERVYR